MTYQARFDYGYFKTRERAAAYLEDMYAAGEVCEAEQPRIERRGNRWAITLPAC